MNMTDIETSCVRADVAIEWFLTRKWQEFFGSFKSRLYTGITGSPADKSYKESTFVRPYWNNTNRREIIVNADRYL